MMSDDRPPKLNIVVPYDRLPRNCTCPKRKFTTEQKALDDAAARGRSDFIAYTCPGTSTWHHTRGGFHHTSLKTVDRLLAFHLDRGLTVAEAYERMGLARYTRLWNTANATLSGFAAAGVIRKTRTDDGGHHVDWVDHGRLLRIMQIGWPEYLADVVRDVDLVKRGESGQSLDVR